jgi:hypothetical protein
MVTEWGMSEKLGMIRYGSSHEDMLMGYGGAQAKGHSDKTAELVDSGSAPHRRWCLYHARKMYADHSTATIWTASLWPCWNTKPCRATISKCCWTAAISTALNRHRSRKIVKTKPSGSVPLGGHVTGV